MSNFGVNIFTQFSSSSPPTNSTSMDVVSGFFSIAKFTKSTTPSAQDIDNAIFVHTNLVFSPDGCLYFIKTNNNKPTGAYDNSLTFLNPLTASVRMNYSTNWNNWSQINYSKFSAYTNAIQYPRYFLCISGNLGYGITGSGYILIRDSSYPGNGGDFNYYLVVNPFNRSVDSNGSLMINDTTELTRLNNYCETVEYQDSMCYCSNSFGGNQCIYGYTEGQTNGDVILNKNISGEPSNAISIQTIKSHCGCNDICKNYGGYNNIKQKPSCADVKSITLCAGGISGGTGSTINAPNLTLIQNCGDMPKNPIVPGKPVNPGKPPPKSQSKNTILYISIVIAIILVIIIYFFFFY